MATVIMVCSHALVGRHHQAGPLREVARRLRMPDEDDEHASDCTCIGCALLLDQRTEAHHPVSVLMALQQHTAVDELVLLASDTGDEDDSIDLADKIAAYQQNQAAVFDALLAVPPVTVVPVSPFGIDGFRQAVQTHFDGRVVDDRVSIAQVGGTNAVCGAILGALAAGVQPAVVNLHPGQEAIEGTAHEITATADPARVLMRAGAWGQAATHFQGGTTQHALQALHHAQSLQWDQVRQHLRHVDGVAPPKGTDQVSMERWLWSVTTYKLTAGDRRAVLAFRVWAEAWLNRFRAELPVDALNRERLDFVQARQLRQTRHWDPHRYPGLDRVDALSSAIDAVNAPLHGGQVTHDGVEQVRTALLTHPHGDTDDDPDPFTRTLTAAGLAGWRLQQPHGALAVLCSGTRAGMAEAAADAIAAGLPQRSCVAAVVVHTDEAQSEAGAKEMRGWLAERGVGAELCEVAVDDLGETRGRVHAVVAARLQAGHADGPFQTVVTAVGPGSNAMNVATLLGCARAAAEETTELDVVGLRNTDDGSRLDLAGERVPARLVADGAVAPACAPLLRALDLDTAGRVLQLASRRFDRIRDGVQHLQRALYERDVSREAFASACGHPPSSGNGALDEQLFSSRLTLLRQLADRDRWRCAVETARVVEGTLGTRREPQQGRQRAESFADQAARQLFAWRNACLHPFDRPDELPDSGALRATIDTVRERVATGLANEGVTLVGDDTLANRLSELRENLEATSPPSSDDLATTRDRP